MAYIDRLNYELIDEDWDKYLANVNIINFDFINHQRKGTPLENSIANYKTIYKNYLKQMPANDAALAACFRSSRKDLTVEKDLRDELFRKWNNTSSSSHLANSNSSSCSNSCRKNFSKDKEALKKKRIKSTLIVGSNLWSIHL